MSFAVIKTGGKQYKVQAGEIIKIERLEDSKHETKLEFKEVLAYGDDKNLELGDPTISGAKVVFSKEKNYTISIDDIIQKVNKKTKIVFLANPNNPTGTFICKKDVVRLHESIPKNILLVYDAAYSEFVVNDDYIDGSELAEKNENVIMLRTFSKLHGLASLRLGWGYASENIIENLMKVRGPFSVNAAAIMAGVAALKDLEFQKKAIRHNLKWMSWFEKELKLLNLDFKRSITNFLLIKFPIENKYNAKNAESFLASKGILVRGMKVYGLSNYLRVSIGTEEENIKFVNELKTFFKK